MERDQSRPVMYTEKGRQDRQIFERICKACRKGDDGDRLLMCDKCDFSFHVFCLRPPLHEVPRGEWRCPRCVANGVLKPNEASRVEQARQVQRGTENVVSVSKLQDLVKEVDTMQQIDDEVENVLFTLADDFTDNVANASCLVAKNRKSSVLETNDVAIVLERQHGLYIPGFGGEDLHTYKKTTTAEAHKQRVALVRKTLKKF